MLCDSVQLYNNGIWHTGAARVPMHTGCNWQVLLLCKLLQFLLRQFESVQGTFALLLCQSVLERHCRRVNASKLVTQSKFSHFSHVFITYTCFNFLFQLLPFLLQVLQALFVADLLLSKLLQVKNDIFHMEISRHCFVIFKNGGRRQVSCVWVKLQRRALFSAR